MDERFFKFGMFLWEILMDLQVEVRRDLSMDVEIIYLENR